MPKFLGIDVGSSSIKGAVLHPERGAIEDLRSRPFPGPLPAASRLTFEVDCEAVTDSVRNLCEELAALEPGCDGIVMCGQMGGLVFADDRGRALSPYYSWRDQRTIASRPGGNGNYFDDFCARLGEDDIAAVGRELRVGSTAVLLFWLAENGGIPAGTPYPVTLVNAVIARMCAAPPVTEATMALGMLDLRSGDWHAPLYEAAEVASLPRSRLQAFHAPAGVVRCGGRELPCYPAVGDHQAALLGIGLRPGELSINASTGSQVSQVTPQLVLGDYQTRPFFDGQFLNTITHLPAGRSLNVILDLLTELPRAQGIALGDPWDDIARATARIPDEELEVDLAFFAGPMGDHGAVTGIRTDNLTVGALFRGAFRNMADNYLACARRIAPREDWTAVLLSGGLPQRLKTLQEMIGRRFSATLRQSSESEETLMGLLELARKISHV